MDTKIVVGTDGSPEANVAVDWAAEDAERKGSSLRVVHVVDHARYSVPRLSPLDLKDQLIKAGQELLEHTAQGVREARPGLKVMTQLMVGHPVAGLRVMSEDAIELVVGTRGLSGLTGAVLGSVSVGVAGHANGVVVVARQAPAGEEVVVGVDGSRAGGPALAHAFAEAELRGRPLRVVHAWEVPIHFISFDRDAALDAHSRTLRELLAPWREERPGVDVIEDLACAPPTSALVTASKRASLLVVGSRGRGGVKSAVLGSVSHGVLHHVPTVRWPWSADRGCEAAGSPACRQAHPLQSRTSDNGRRTLRLTSNVNPNRMIICGYAPEHSSSRRNSRKCGSSSAWVWKVALTP